MESNRVDCDHAFVLLKGGNEKREALFLWAEKKEGRA